MSQFWVGHSFGRYNLTLYIKFAINDKLLITKIMTLSKLGYRILTEYF